jgi:hypothetical protein
VLLLQLVELALDVTQALKLGDGLGLRRRGRADEQAITGLFAPARKHEGMDAQRLGDILHEDARLLAHGHGLELELQAIAFGLLWSRGAHGTDSPLGRSVHKSQARFQAFKNGKLATPREGFDQDEINYTVALRFQ